MSFRLGITPKIEKLSDIIYYILDASASARSEGTNELIIIIDFMKVM